MIRCKPKIHAEKCRLMPACECAGEDGLSRGDDKSEWADKYYYNLNERITIRGACPAWSVGKLPVSHYNILGGVPHGDLCRG